LGEATDLVGEFVLGQFQKDGPHGFVDRAGNPDLYYTVFGIECLIALAQNLPVEALGEYLREFKDGRSLDFIHLCCLTHCWAALSLPQDHNARVDTPDPSIGAAMAGLIETHRTPDGGYNVTPDAAHGSAYGCYMAYSAFQNLGRPPKDLDAMIECLAGLKQDQGGYANDKLVTVATTPTTAAVVTLLRHLDQPLDQQTGQWLLSQCHVQGGFLATSHAPMPDLLSTAVGLHALSSFEVDLDRIREPCIDFIDSLWTNKGSFHGNWADNDLDVEYTFYGLLALGHLSV